jgi:hypothetical protein
LAAWPCCNPEAELGVARAVRSLNIPLVLSSVSSTPLEAVAETLGESPRWFQLYADWLEEHDQPDRAELIRVQCALAGIACDDPRRPNLEMRANVLLTAHETQWRQEAPAWARQHIDFRRGFVDEVRVGLRTFLKGAPGLFRRAPATTLRLTSVFAARDSLSACPQLAAVRSLHLHDVQATAVRNLL